MKFARRTKILAGHPDLIPLVNVCLLLFLFFIVVMQFGQEPAIPIQLPEAATTNTAPASAQPPLIITVSAENPSTHANPIFFNDEIVDLKQLGIMLAQAAHQSPYRECVVRADKSTPHGMVVSILSLAQQAGLKTVRLATRDPGAPAPAEIP